MSRALAGALALWASGCCSYHQHTPHEGPPLVEVARFADDAPTGRIFVNFPRWWHTPRWSVVEILPDGTLHPYPDERWNTWPAGDRQANASAFVCVQSLRLDAEERLWILDPANPGFQTGVVRGGPKLVCVDLAHRAIYIADSGAAALVVMDLTTGAARRVLAGHPLVSDEGITPRVGGWPWRTFFWITPTVHVDGLALSPDGEQLYFHVLNGHSLYRPDAYGVRSATITGPAGACSRGGAAEWHLRVPTAALRDPALSDDAVAAAAAAAAAAQVARLATTSAVDGMNCDAEGRVYWTALELDAIQRLAEGGRIETVVRDGRIRWPDSIGFHQDQVYFTLSQIHLAWPFNWGFPPRRDPYFLFRVPKR